jgi:hypothetical protein
MRHWIRDQNIRLFRAALSSDLPSEQRATIEALLAEELAGIDDAQRSLIAPTSQIAPTTRAANEPPVRQDFGSARFLNDKDH